jgi:hypothetical protein
VIFFQPQHILHRDLKPANILGVSVWEDDFRLRRLKVFKNHLQNFRSTLAFAKPLLGSSLVCLLINIWPFARLAHYLREFSEANVIFLKSGLANVDNLASIYQTTWQVTTIFFFLVIMHSLNSPNNEKVIN